MKTLIKNGRIYDGTGRAAFTGSLLFEDDRILEVSEGEIPVSTDAAVIDAEGRAVTPGFIDQHRHADLAIFRDSFGVQELAQGLTTVGTGVCGFSCTPCADKSDGFLKYANPIMGPSSDGTTYPRINDYLNAARTSKLSTNASTLQGLGAVRIAVKGFDPSPYTGEEIRKAQKLVEEAIDAGVKGFSSGLVYNPEMYTSEQEIIQILAPCKGADLLYMPHIRDEGDFLPEAVKEVINIAEENGMKLGISHFKALGPDNWHVQLDSAIAEIEDAKNRGMDVTVDVYPYAGSSTTLSSKLPRSFLTRPFDEIIQDMNKPQEIERLRHCYLHPAPKDEKISPDFKWSHILITGVELEENKKYLNKTVSEAFQISGYDDIYDFVSALLYSERGSVCIVELAMHPDDVERIIKLPYSNIISDSLYNITEYPHPRAYAAFPHMIKEYVINRKTVSMEEAVHKMTLAPAKRMGYDSRGILQKGAFADILIFDPEKLGDNATFDKGKQLSTGMDFVFVNGILAFADGKQLSRAGRYLI